MRFRLINLIRPPGLMDPHSCSRMSSLRLLRVAVWGPIVLRILCRP